MKLTVLMGKWNRSDTSNPELGTRGAHHPEFDDTAARFVADELDLKWSDLVCRPGNRSRVANAGAWALCFHSKISTKKSTTPSRSTRHTTTETSMEGAPGTHYRGARVEPVRGLRLTGMVPLCYPSLLRRCRPSLDLTPDPLPFGSRRQLISRSSRDALVPSARTPEQGRPVSRQISTEEGHEAIRSRRMSTDHRGA